MLKRRFFLIPALVLLVLALIAPFGMEVHAAENSAFRVVIEDDADLLTAEEEERLFQKMRPIAEYANIGFHTVQEHAYPSTQAYAEAYYVKTFGGGVSGTIFLIDMRFRMIYIVSDGAAYRIVTNSRAETITDNIYTYASRRDYYGCAAEAFSEI
ncbi:MAG: TPM domain-containing protein, partial [Lachnospiraceae bacterium]|nr:TPM domain-containing protein [Lachnospiraceae bacterium]